MAIAERDRPLLIDFSADCECLSNMNRGSAVLTGLIADTVLYRVWTVPIADYRVGTGEGPHCDADHSLLLIAYILVMVFTACPSQVAKELGDKIKIIKIDTEKNMELSSQLRVCSLAADWQMMGSVAISRPNFLTVA